MLRQYELLERIRFYNPDADEALINRAYVFMMKAHGSQQRAGGDPYYSHPVEVAGILTERHLDDETIATAILHDTIENTMATPELIGELFGRRIAGLVEGVTKVSKIEALGDHGRTVENLHDFVATIPDDIRILFVKLADRLHNMRSLQFMQIEDKRKRIARETLDIYAPLAERIGMYEFMQELQTLAFRELEPEAFNAISRRLEQTSEGELIALIGGGIHAHLEANGIDAKVQGHEKHPYAIWRKMAERHVSFGHLAETISFRVIVASVEDAYRALGLIHQRWPMVPGRFKDFISTPKRNGYRSLHTTMIHDEQMRIDIHIRTGEMDAVATHGLAAFWPAPSEEISKHSWIADFIEILDHVSANDIAPQEEKRSERTSAPVSAGTAERILTKIASPRIVTQGSQIDAANGEYEVDDGVPLEWLPRHLRDCAQMLHDGVAANAPAFLRTAFNVYARVIEDNQNSPIVQTLIFSASMIKAATTHPDFDYWSNGLLPRFEEFLKDHQRLIDHYPQLEARQAALAKLPVNFSTDIGLALSEFVAASRKVLDLLVESGVATDKAKEILRQQLDLAQSIAASLPEFISEATDRNEWTPLHDQAANNLGVWIQVRDNLGFALSLTAHPQLQVAMAMLVPAISKLIEAFIFLAK